MFDTSLVDGSSGTSDWLLPHVEILVVDGLWVKDGPLVNDGSDGWWKGGRVVLVPGMGLENESFLPDTTLDHSAG